ncbi:MAG: hypothetical protein LBB36_06150 [Fibromonadaceae bacterium]|jgi:hypothetical protein|nr:hypothetical protein [Fibromonadaceae bacterium]
MRKLHKKQILDLLKTLDNATDEIKRLFSNKQFPTAINLLADCQETAVGISDFIDELHGKDSKSVQLLAEFAEMLYKASTEINAGNANSDFANQLKKQVADIKSCVNEELKVNKTEVVFFPYKASMWDSLESIYLAAKEDPDCDAYVVPIPYYDRLPGGKFGQMHYEGDKYPSYVQVADWKAYNVEERRPDAVFVHNPYDDLNLVTCVHPDFYCKRLRGLTDCLVYVPYFVGDGKNVQEHFCTLPGCLFAHKVIVQTEDERKIYVNTYKEFAKRNSTPESFDKISSKFLALGSPKLDKAINAKREDYEIPAEWEKLIAGKKVVFYNTSIGALLENTVEDGKPSNKYLQKVRSVFEFFKKQNDAVLLWRPHPLLESTIKSMRPWLLQEYAEIVSEYKSGGYGIYDDSGDLNRAIAVSDMYYGDGSSVARLYEAAGKAVVGQGFGDVQVPTTLGFYDDGVYVWFIDGYNMLYRHNKQSKETEYIRMVTGQDYLAYRGITECDNKLYFAPFLANEILVFDMNKKNFEQINFESKRNTDVKNKFKGAVRFKNFICFIPYEFQAIMRLNTDTNEVEYFSEWVNEVSKLQTSKLQGFENFLIFGFCVIGAEIAMVINGANAIMFFNMETGGYEVKNIGENVEQCNAICFDGKNYYLSSCYENYIVKWNKESDEILKIKFPNVFSRKENNGSNFLIQYFNEHILLLPVGANNAYKINISTDEIMELPELTEHFEDKNLNWYYAFNTIVNENFIYASTMNKGIVEYNSSIRELNFIKPYFGIEPGLLYIIYRYDEWKSKRDMVVAENKNYGQKIFLYLCHV